MTGGSMSPCRCANWRVGGFEVSCGSSKNPSGAIVYTDFADELGEGTVVNLTGVSVGTNYERFLAKARAYLRDHEGHVTLQRLRRDNN